MTYEELLAENKRLRHKLSPLEDTEFTKELALKMAVIDLTENFSREFRKAPHVVITPRELADLCGYEATIPTLTKIGRSLQAMCWERSALHGNLVFVMPLREYEDGVQ